MIIDTHAHFVPPALIADVKAQKRLFPSLKTKEEKGSLCFSFAGAEMTRPVMPLLSDVAKRGEWLASQDIDRQVVGGWLDSFGYELPAEEGADWSRFYNEHLLAGVKALPALVPLATVPMQSGKHAAAVLEEALDAGFHGAMIGTQPKGLGGVLDDPDLTPFWEVAHAKKATLFIHPMYGVDDDRLRAYGLVNALGRVTDTSIAVARLMHSGHLLEILRRDPRALPRRRGAPDGARPPRQGPFRPPGRPRRSDRELQAALLRYGGVRRQRAAPGLRHGGCRQGRARHRLSVPDRRLRADEHRQCADPERRGARRHRRQHRDAAVQHQHDRKGDERPHRPAGSPRGGPAPRHRQGQLYRRREPARPGLCRDGALAARACAHPRRSTPTAALAVPGVLAVLTGRDLDRRRH